MSGELLSRDSFRQSVFERDGHRCVLCDAAAKDAHHIMERRLFTAEHEFGGYFLDNGASVCEACHIASEQTTISTEQLREATGIKKVVLPSHLYDDERYDKWGNIILPNGKRLKGELFHDESVQKILSSVLPVFTHYVKYPRTHHLPHSPGMHDDDRMHESMKQWEGRQVVVTLKMDGENTTMYRDHVHARSVDSGSHPSRAWVKNFWASIAHEIPEDWRICGENLYAAHSIAYLSLPSYFLGFSVWNERNFCLPWDESLEIFRLLGIQQVPVLWEGEFSETVIREELPRMLNYDHDEGFVLRTRDGFTSANFRRFVGKFVRPEHIKTTKHWMRGQAVVKNGLASG